MSALGPATVADIAEAIRAAVHEQLAATPASGGAPERSCVVWGQIAADGCDCGQLAVTVTRLYASRLFPDEAGASGAATATAGCGPPYLIADVTVSLLRCVAVPDVDQGELSVPCERLAAEARTFHADLHAVRTGVYCVLSDLLRAETISEFLVVDQTPVGPLGGCAGSELHLKVELVNDCPCAGQGGG